MDHRVAKVTAANAIELYLSPGRREVPAVPAPRRCPVSQPSRSSWPLQVWPGLARLHREVGSGSVRGVLGLDWRPRPRRQTGFVLPGVVIVEGMFSRDSTSLGARLLPQTRTDKRTRSRILGTICVTRANKLETG